MFSILLALLLAALVCTAVALAASVRMLRQTRLRLAAADRQARTCPLTGLANRLTFIENLAAAVRVGGPVAVAMLDVDSFKQINDRYGHQTGDQILRAIGNRLRQMPHPVILAARLSGDEFVLLVRGGPLEADAATREACTAITASPVEVPGVGMLPVKVSAGRAQHRPGLTPAQLLHHADLAMYDAKIAGRRGETSKGNPPRVRLSAVATRQATAGTRVVHGRGVQAVR
jgi:diguanylate cyclase